MTGECFMCADPARNKYTLILDTGQIFENKPLCPECHDSLEQTDFLEIQDEPVLIRGGNSDEEKPA